MCLIGNFRACRASKIGDPELPWSVHDLAFRSSSLFGMIDTLPLSKFSTYSSTLLADAILGPLGFGWRGRIPFALTTRIGIYDIQPLIVVAHLLRRETNGNCLHQFKLAAVDQ